MKVSFKDSEKLDAVTEKSLRKSIEAKDGTISRLQKQNDEVRARINRFIASVDSVRFDFDEGDAPLWTAQWGAFLLTGKQPQPVAPEPEVRKVAAVDTDTGRGDLIVDDTDEVEDSGLVDTTPE